MVYNRMSVAPCVVCLMASGPMVAMAAHTDFGGGGDGGSDPQGMIAKHRGAGSYSVMDGDTEVLDRLTKAEAEEFNDLQEADRPGWVDALRGAREKEAADREQGGGGAITQTADTQAGNGDAPPRVDRDIDGPDGRYSVKNTSDTGQAIMASGVMITIAPRETRPLALSARELALIEPLSYLEVTETVDPKE